MSHVDNCILSFSVLEDENRRMTEVDGWLIANRLGPFGSDIGTAWTQAGEGVSGGFKALETPLYVAAFNYLDEAAFVAHLESLPWEDPKNVQLLIKRQHEDRFVDVPLNPPKRLGRLHCDAATGEALFIEWG